MDGPPENDLCSVCHDAFHLPCQANCSHWFCGQCILSVWDHAPALRPCQCPMCRRLITLLIPSEILRSQQHERDAVVVLERIQQYNRHFGAEARSLIQRLRDLPLLLRRMFRELSDPQRSLPLVFRVRFVIGMVLSFIYFLSPMDILPEGALGFVGFLDDFVVLLVVFFHIAAVYRSILLARHRGP